jgi:hypothetical protein
MLDVGIIVPVEESDWISPMVIQPKNTREIQICIDLWSLNAACVHDPFPTPFTDEVLRMLEEGKPTPSWMVSLDIIKFRSQRKIRPKPPSQPMGVLCIYSHALQIKKFPHSIFSDSGSNIQGVYP